MKIGLALGGGGAKGFSHLGVINVLREAGVPIDVVTGTSIGALVGAVLAADRLTEFAEESSSIKLADIPKLLSPAWSLSGFFSGENALELLSEHLPQENIEDLPIPYAATAVDLCSGKRIVLTSGNLRQAIRASIAIPGVFTPVPYDDMLLVDGGVLEPVPVKTARALGADFVIAVDLFGENLNPISRESRLPSGLQSALGYLKNLSSKFTRSPDQENPSLPGIIDIMESTLSVVEKELTALQLVNCPADAIIQPSLSDVGLLDFHQGNAIIARGEAAARERLPELREKLRKFRSKK